MGLFINNREHPEVFKAKQGLQEPNQTYLKHDFLTELISQQERANAELRESLAELKLSSIEQEKTHVHQWNQIDEQLAELRKRDLENKNFEEKMAKSLKTLNKKNIHLQMALENESVIKQVIMNEVNGLSRSIKNISSRLEKNEEDHHELSQKMNEQLDSQKELANKVDVQEEFQGVFLKRLDEQEALMEKFSRQLNHFRSILFERANHLAEKIENGYKHTSAYVQNLMKGTDQPLTLIVRNQKKEENPKK